MSQDWEMIKTITVAEHHFNNLCFKIRSLASTWLLATFAGVGFLLSKKFDLRLSTEEVIVFLCWVGSLGILVLWVLDLLVYQQLLNVWFDARKPIEKRNPNFPQIRESIKDSQFKGRASNLIKIFYLSLISAPLLFGIYICIYWEINKIILFCTVGLLIAISGVVYLKTPGR